MSLLTRISTTVVVGVSVMLPACHSASAQGHNPSGGVATVNSGSYNNGPLFDGYDNEGTLIIQQGASGEPQFNGDFLGVSNNGGAVSVSGGSYNNDYTGLYSSNGAMSVDGGAFGNNTYGIFNNLASTAHVNGGSIDNNGIGLLNWSSTAFVTGGSFGNNSSCDITNIDGTIYLSGGTFGGGSGCNLNVYSGTAYIYGKAFSAPLGNLAQGGGTLSWTQENGSVQTLNYYNGGAIELINSPATVPEPSSLASFAVMFALSAGALLRSRRRIRAE